MRFLIDQPISWEVAQHLNSLGHDAIHVRDIGLGAADDTEILIRAEAEHRIIITQDTDFGTLLMTRGHSRPSVILFRMRDGRPSTQMDVLTRFVSMLEADLAVGAIVVIEDASIRVRRLT